MAEAFIGEIRLLPYTFYPQGWYPCDGRLLPIQQYAPLFALLGNRYGGDGKTTFGLPDLRARVAVGTGDDPTDTFDPVLATHGGDNGVTLNTTTVPPHTHALNAADAAAIGFRQEVATPTGNWFSAPVLVKTTKGTEQTNSFVTPPVSSTVTLNAATLSPYVATGGPHENRQPYLSLQYCICFDGYFPARN